ncbi:hypothetical protein [Halomarina oriensis]|uniref:hypothetical protein n=1 Tax=Halomarina oriensis TaxID=671145 RepID=UPI0018EF1F43|nr:hypothetical protein [Halomarina oriensis]
MNRRILICTDCEQVIAGRVEDDGSIILPLADNTCNCGGDSFDVVEASSDPVDAAPG